MSSLVSLLAQTSAAPPPSDNEGALVWAIVLLVVSLALVFLELFVPSGGLIGVLAGVSAVGSIVAFFRYDETWGLLAAGAYIVLGPIALIYGFKWWLNSPLGRRMILSNPNEADPLDPEASSAMSAEHARQERHALLQQLVGARGVAITVLRPVGAVRIDGQRIEALAETGVIEAGAPIVVTTVHDNQVKVRRAD